MPDFERRRSEVDAGETDARRATARLPGLDVEIMHRRAIEGDAEEISISLRAAPSFEAFARALEPVNPFVFWAQSAQFAGMSWLQAARALTLPWTLALPRPSDGAPPSAQERHLPG